MSKILLHIRHSCAECRSLENTPKLIRTFGDNTDWEWERFGGIGTPKTCMHNSRLPDEYYTGEKVLDTIPNPNGFGWIVKTEESRYIIDPVDFYNLPTTKNFTKSLTKRVMNIKPLESSEDINEFKKVWTFMDEYNEFLTLREISNIASNIARKTRMSGFKCSGQLCKVLKDNII